jgi:spoIIIJ-associated protein
MKEEIKNIVLEFFDKMWVVIDDVIIKEELEDIFSIKIETQDSGLLIGTHWTTFESIQNILRSIFFSKYERKIKIHIEINDYIHNKDEKLFAFIDREIARAKETWRNMKLPKFSSYERKKIHDYIGTLNDSEIFTKSKWEWSERRLYIFLNKNNQYEQKPQEKIGLTIDIDWDDI